MPSGVSDESEKTGDVVDDSRVAVSKGAAETGDGLRPAPGLREVWVCLAACEDGYHSERCGCAAAAPETVQTAPVLYVTAFARSDVMRWGDLGSERLVWKNTASCLETWPPSFGSLI